MAEIEGFAEVLAVLRTKPGKWKAMGHDADQFKARALCEALAAGADQTDPGELYDFAVVEDEEKGFVVYGRFDGPETSTH